MSINTTNTNINTNTNTNTNTPTNIDTDTSVNQFFDQHAADWDQYQNQKEGIIIDKILDRAGFNDGDRILDVACGTGILVPHFIKKNISLKNVVALDSSENMLRVLQRKFPEVITINRAFEDCTEKYDPFTKIIIFNAFPHFANPLAIFKKAYDFLQRGGKLVIAHSMNRQRLDDQHRGVGGAVKDHILMSDEAFVDGYTKSRFIKSIVEDADYFYSEGTKT